MCIYRLCILIIISFYIFGCVEKTTYSGKIITNEDLNIKISDKDGLLEKFGQPSYIDSLLNKYFYFTEKRKNKNFFENEAEYSYLFVFQLDENDKIIGTESINLLDKKNHNYNKKVTDSSIIKRGLLEKVFGGIGPEQLPNSP